MNFLKVQSFGGQIIEATILGHKIFYCPSVLPQAPSPTRAGVPILFPQFSNQGELPKHGVARLQHWKILTSKKNRTSAQVLITEQPTWPHCAQLKVESYIQDNCVSIQLTVHNIGKSSFEWTGGLHPYFLVDNVTNISIKGLTKNKLHLNELDLLQEAHDMTYPASSQLIELKETSFNLTLEQKGFSHWVLWNPGAKHTLQDIPYSDWSKFICIEPICLSPIKLRENEKWVGILKISLTQK